MKNEKIRDIQSSTDEDASIGHKSKDDSFFGYKTHIAMTEERIITGLSVTSGKAVDTKEMVPLIEQTKHNGVIVDEVIGDKAYSSKDNIDYCNTRNMKLISRLNTVITDGNKRQDEFVFNKDAGTMQCPEGNLAIRCDIKSGKYENKYYTYNFSLKQCKKCPRYGTCCKIGAKAKTYSITIVEGSRREHQEFENSDYFKERVKERYKIEAKNAELKQSHGLKRCKYVGFVGMQIQSYFTAFVANVKRIIRLTDFQSV